MQSRYYLFFFNVFYFFACCSHPTELNRLLKNITRTRCKARIRHKYQNNLIELLKTNKSVPEYKDDWHACVSALSIDNNFPIISQNLHVLPEAIDAFYLTPNFLKVTRKLLLNVDNENAKGYMYEITQALLLHKQLHQIRAFGIYQVTPVTHYTQREFDLITDTHWYECKAQSKWPSLQSKQGRKLQQQFSDQKQITHDYNLTHNTTIVFEVRSQQSAPDYWRTWFQEQGIMYTSTH